MTIHINLGSPQIKAVFFDRHGGTSQGLYESLNTGLSVGDNPEHVRQNRQYIAAYFGQKLEQLIYLHQIHSTHVVEAQEAAQQQKPMQGDALISDKKGVILAIQTADCMPILCADSHNNVIAAIHAGWRSAFDGIIEKTIDKMIEKGAQASQIHAAIGPCIHQKSYEVDEIFKQRFLEKSAKNEQFFIPSQRKNHYLFDLPGYGAACLKQKDVKHIQPSLWDTFSETHRFFSYRHASIHNQSETGRLTACITFL